MLKLFHGSTQMENREVRRKRPSKMLLLPYTGYKYPTKYTPWSQEKMLVLSPRLLTKCIWSSRLVSRTCLSLCGCFLTMTGGLRKNVGTQAQKHALPWDDECSEKKAHNSLKSLLTPSTWLGSGLALRLGLGLG